MTRPKEIYWFTLIQLASLAFGLFSTLSDWDGLLAEANAAGQLSGEMTSTIAIFTIGFGFGVNLILLALIWFRNSVARWIYIVLGVIGTVMGAVTLAGATFGRTEIIAAVQMVVGLVLIGILFMPNVTRWFARTDDAAKFD